MAYSVPSKKSAGAFHLGFTLIELLVVIAIIGILAGLLFPAITAALDRGKLARCSGNLREMGTALVNLTLDTNGALPWFIDSNDVTWDTRLLEYMGDARDVFICPSDPELSDLDSGKDPRSYACNGGVVQVSNIGSLRYPFGDTSGNGPLGLDQVEARTGPVLLISERPGREGGDSVRGYIGEGNYVGLNGQPSTYHLDGRGGNYLFGNMSVSFEPVEVVEVSANTDRFFVDISQ